MRDIPSTARPLRPWTAGDWALGGILVLTLVTLLTRAAVSRPVPALASAAAFLCSLVVPYVIATWRNMPAPSWMVNTVFWVPLLAGAAAEVIVARSAIRSMASVFEGVVTGVAYSARGLFYGGLAWAALFAVFAAVMGIKVQPELRRRTSRGT